MNTQQTSAPVDRPQLVAPGVWRWRLGQPEPITPITLRDIPPRLTELERLPAVARPPWDPADMRFAAYARGCTVELPLGDGEQVYGFGLQLKSLNQTAKKRICRVNADPQADSGDSNAPVPFYVSTAGYGVFIDTARYAVVNTGNLAKAAAGTVATGDVAAAGDLAELYRVRAAGRRQVLIEVPVAQGVDVYVFGGPALREAVQRYALFSGGGCLPPLWGLGIWYRTFRDYNAAEVLAVARDLREHHIPCDVLGLEPGWHSQSYSCSYSWSPERFPDPPAFVRQMRALGFHLNLWEHAFVHPRAPIYEPLKPVSGDYAVWGGLVPDFTCPAARQVFGDYHGREFVERGISGFKLDECDNSDYTGGWSFPESSRFPGGFDGEQMHTQLGRLYQQTLYAQFIRRNQRTMCQARSTHALAAPYPFTLASDLYDLRDFVRGVTTAGFSGLLWTPEVRDAASVEELVRRVQVVVLSPLALINPWYIKHPPWRQPDKDKNDRGEFLPNAAEVEDICRDLFRLRMSLLPYLYAAFARYRFEGVPPFRALVMDSPDDANTHNVDNQWLMGDSLLVAPMFVGQSQRQVYLPAGDWHGFHTGRRYAGGQAHSVTADLRTVPMFVKTGSILPLAEPPEFVAADTCWTLTAHTFGQPCEPCRLFEDDGETFDFERGQFNTVTLEWDAAAGPRVTRTGHYPHERYRVARWEHHG